MDYSSTEKCPVCGDGEMEVMGSDRPVETVSMECFKCGFNAYTIFDMASNGDRRVILEEREQGDEFVSLSKEQRVEYLKAFQKLGVRNLPTACAEKYLEEN